MMTLDDIRNSRKEFLTPAEAAPVLGVAPQSIRVAARLNPALLGFPVMVVGSRTKIPRVPLLRFLGAID